MDKFWKIVDAVIARLMVIGLVAFIGWVAVLFVLALTAP